MHDPTLTLASSLTPIFTNTYVMLALIIGGSCVLLGFFDAVRKTSQSRHRERTRRELFAYVAEGSISAEDAQNLLAASSARNDWQKKIAQMVEWGTIDADEARNLCDAFKAEFKAEFNPKGDKASRAQA